MKARIAVTLSLGLLMLTAQHPAQASMELARQKNCVACHAVDKTLIGPSFKDIAAKYAADKEALPRLAKKVREGGVGVWGNKVTPMPPNPQVTDEEASTLVRWILTTK